MARTYRRQRHRYEYRWVLRYWNIALLPGTYVQLDARSRAGRRAIARFHSDAEITVRSTAPRWYRKAFERRLETANDRQLRRWLADPDYDPVVEVRHRHDANYSWW